MKLFKIIQAGLISLILGLCSTMAFAMHESGFELEGNAVQDSETQDRALVLMVVRFQSYKGIFPLL